MRSPEVLVGPDIDTDNSRPVLAAAQSLQHSAMAFVVEPHAIDHGLILAQAEQARAGISRLRPRCHGSHFDKAKTQGQHGVRHLGILVKACGEAQWIFEVQPKT